MAFLKTVIALCGVSFVAACVSNETVGRSETSDFHYSMTSMIDERDVHQSLAAVSMKDEAGEALQYSARAREIIANYGR